MCGDFRFRSAPIACLFFALAAGVAVAQGTSERPRDAAASRAREEAVRERVEKIPEMLTLAGIRPGASVADVGAGTGFLTVRLARLVGPTGRVYAEDVAPRALAVLRDRVREEGLRNVDIIQGTADDPKLPANSLDAIVILIAFHEMSEPASMLAHMREALRPGGRLVMAEPTSRSVAPERAAQRHADVLSAELAEADLRKAGFQIAELRDPFVTELSAHYLRWLIVAHRSPGILLTPIARSDARPAPDGRCVVSPPVQGDITRADLRLSVDDTRKRIDTGGAVVVDLRPDADYRRGHVPGAVSILAEEFDAKAPELIAQGKPVILYCD